MTPLEIKNKRLFFRYITENPDPEKVATWLSKGFVCEAYKKVVVSEAVVLLVAGRSRFRYLEEDEGKISVRIANQYLLLDFLMANGASLNKTYDRNGETALTIACGITRKEFDDELINKLLALGSDPNDVDKVTSRVQVGMIVPQNALQKACVSNFILIPCLLNHGAKISQNKTEELSLLLTRLRLNCRQCLKPA